eukprot:1161887-Pleurochrysis_carterae.AAC.4
MKGSRRGTLWRTGISITKLSILTKLYVRYMRYRDGVAWSPAFLVARTSDTTRRSHSKRADGAAALPEKSCKPEEIG